MTLYKSWQITDVFSGLREPKSRSKIYFRKLILISKGNAFMYALWDDYVISFYTVVVKYVGVELYKTSKSKALTISHINHKINKQFMSLLNMHIT